MSAGAVSLHEAALALGVHYQTAYKWVRAGSLPAVRVGGSYRIDVEDLARFAAARDAPHAPPKRRPRLGFARLAERLHAALVDGDEGTARRLVAGLLSDGLSLTEVAQEVIVPAIREIGAAWHAGTVSIASEHRATAIVERILGEHAPNPRGRRRGRAVVAALAGDRHSLPTVLAMVALRDDNWHVEHLGADLPADEILRLAEDGEIDLFVLTVTATHHASAATVVAERLRSDGHTVLVGSPGATLLELQEQARNK